MAFGRSSPLLRPPPLALGRRGRRLLRGRLLTGLDGRRVAGEVAHQPVVVGTHLTEDEIVLYREWIENNRELERIVTEMRGLSSRVLAFITGREAP